MKRLVFLLLAVLLFGFNYGYSQKNDFEEAIRKCKETCGKYNSPKFCKRICEIEISNPRWKLYRFGTLGSAYFYDLESISTSHNIVKVWEKIIFSERDKQHQIKKYGEKYENLDQTLNLLKIDCSEKRFQILVGVDYASDGSIIYRGEIPEYLAEWYSIPPDSIIEKLFEEVCETEE